MNEKAGQSKRIIACWNDCLEAVADMRSAQKEYFKTQSSPALFRAKELERIVDCAIADRRERINSGAKP